MNIKEYFTKKEKAFSNRKDKNFLLTSVILGVLFHGGNRYCKTSVLCV